MARKFSHMMAPVKVRNFVLKNRMESTNSMPHFVQGPEKYPADSTMTHFVNRARSGAAIVTITGINNFTGLPPFPDFSDVSHFPDFDLYDPGCQNYLMQLAELVHGYDSLISVGLFTVAKMFPLKNPDGTMEVVSAMGKIPPNYTNSDVSMFNDYVRDDVSVETLEKVAQSFAQQSAILKRLGYDMVTIHMCYRAQLLGQFISSKTNLRTDDFNGTIENRAKFPLMVFKAIREAVGDDFLIEIQVSGEEDGGNTLEETIQFLKMAEDYVDIVQVRSGEADPNHPTGFCLEKTPFLYMAEAIKKSNVNMLVSNAGGWHHPEIAEAAIAEGKIDLIGMARAWISNENYGNLVAAGKDEDIVPCLRCNKCHGRTPKDPFVSVCAVNPLIGMEHWKNRLEQIPKNKKKIAVIGGGPGGMRSAIYLHDRGHEVTIYEAEAELGGMIRHSDYVDFKWPLKEYKDYLVNQIAKRPNITVLLNHRVKPDEVTGFDTVIAAVGAQPVTPAIDGINRSHVCFATDALMCSENIGNKVVVIGGGEVGVETGMHLAKLGKEVTVLEMGDRIAPDTTVMHYRSMFQEAWEAIPSLHFELNAKATAVLESAVTYVDASGSEMTLPADTVVLAVGMSAKTDEALSFYDSADEFYMIGDCKKPGTVQTVNRSAYMTSMTI